jgi:3-oxoacyl-[acyl-carrier-protein] synthase-3
MGKIQAAITGVQGWVPDYVLTNAELEKMVDTTDEWITTRTGIKERRILKNPDWATSDMGAEAIKGLLKKTGLDATDIDLIICATVTADHHFPDTANIMCDKIGATNAFGFDINAACSGFLFALATAAQFVETEAYRRVIVVGADYMSAITDYTDRKTCVLFGDAAGAVLLEANEEGNGLIDSVLKSDGSGRVFLYQKAGGTRFPATAETVARREHFIYQDGRPVFKAAVKGMTTAIEEVLRRNDLSASEIDWIVPHQANERILKSVAEHLNFPWERVMLNIDRYGNTTAATIPLCLWEYESQLEKGDKLILTAFGGGFTWGAIYLKWAI